MSSRAFDRPLWTEIGPPARQRAHRDEHAVFLSGNGPLVEVLREALAVDAVLQAKERGQKTSKTLEGRRTSAFVQNIHHFRDEALASDQPPVEKVAGVAAVRLESNCTPVSFSQPE